MTQGDKIQLLLVLHWCRDLKHENENHDSYWVFRPRSPIRSHTFSSQSWQSHFNRLYPPVFVSFTSVATLFTVSICFSLTLPLGKQLLCICGSGCSEELTFPFEEDCHWPHSSGEGPSGMKGSWKSHLKRSGHTQNELDLLVWQTTCYFFIPPSSLTGKKKAASAACKNTSMHRVSASFFFSLSRLACFSLHGDVFKASSWDSLDDISDYLPWLSNTRLCIRIKCTTWRQITTQHESLHS